MAQRENYMPHSKEQVLYDIVQAIREIESFTNNKDFSDYQKDRLLQLGIEREFEIIGEALNRLKSIDSDSANKITDIHRIIGMRNILAHGYDVIDDEIIWHTVQTNLKTLYTEAQSMLDSKS